ncbi:MAG: hypothetical protein J5835_04405 [Bacteroidales bacterium]|nr:hypothetical protein [Bacteroidales bacterium]
MKRIYSTPSIKKKLTLSLERGILAGSVVTKDTTIETAGHKVEERDFSAAEFNHTWQ